jgi:prepilin-type N-terminal cleavage/methylation domain-containing protein
MGTILARPGRRGFTLIELLVVIALLLLLAALAVMLIPGMTDNARAARGGTQVQQWLTVARQRALRDRAPRGLRLFPDKTDPKFVRELQYIEQPEDFIVQPGGAFPFRRIEVDANLAKLEAAAAGAPDFTGGQDPLQPLLWPVQKGDYLEINGVGLPFLITKVNATSLELASPVALPIPLTTHYRIVRAPRPAGDEQLQMPEGIAIDVSTNAMDWDIAPGVKYRNPLPVDPLTGAIDILFAPSGAVIGRGTNVDTIYLWVRDSNLPLFQRDNTIVAVFTRTGAVAAHPADNSTPDPYRFTKDGRASGL